MSNLNQKGPMGEGPMTGRKMGRCGNFGAGRRYPTTPESENTENEMTENPQEQRLGRGQGQRLGKGRGRGMGRGKKNGIDQARSGGMGQNRGSCEMGQGGGGRGMGRRFRDDNQE